MLELLESILPITSLIIALIAVLISYRSSRINRQRFELSRITDQAAYEAVKSTRVPAVDLSLTEIEFRQPTPRSGDSLLARMSVFEANQDDDSIEVVLYGAVANKVSQEILLTFFDHKLSQRREWYPQCNHDVVYLDGVEVGLGRAVLMPKEQRKLVWIDRRPRQQWIDLFNLHHPDKWGDRKSPPPALTFAERLRCLLGRPALLGLRVASAREQKIARIGFRLVAETRARERSSTTWIVEVIETPVVPGRNDKDEVVFADHLRVIKGPLDDPVVYSRFNFDVSLVSPEHQPVVMLSGRAR